MARFNYVPIRTEPPAQIPVTLAEAKAHLRVDSSDEDALITALIEAATGYLDGWAGIMGRCLVTQTWRQTYDAFCPVMRLPLPATELPLPLADIITVTWRDPFGGAWDVPSTQFALRADALGSYVEFVDGFTIAGSLAPKEAVMIDFVAGYGAASNVPAAIKAAILLHVGHLYKNREAVNGGNLTTLLPLAYDALITPYRKIGI